MSKKKTAEKTLELQQSVDMANLAKQQLENQELVEAASAVTVSGYTEERDMANQLLGIIMTANASSLFHKAITLAQLKKVKENKLYRGLRGKTAVDFEGAEIANVGTWDGFCRAIGMSRQKVEEDLRNLSVLGDDALKSMNQIGVGYRELRKLRQLPDEERELIINGEAIKAGDKEALVELIDDLASKHANEKSALEQQSKDLQGDLEATRRVVDDKTKRITELETELHRKAALAPNERAREFSERLDGAVFTVKSAMLEPRSVIQQIQDWEHAPRDLRHACALAIARLKIALDEIQTEYQLPPVDLDFDDSWMQGAE